MVARWSHGGGCVSSRERIFSSSVRVCGGSVVVAQWFCGGRAVVARWSHGGRAVVVPSSRGGCCVSSRERLFSSSVCVCGGSVVVARWFWWSRGGHAVVAFLCCELLCSSSVCVCSGFVVVAGWFCGGAGFWAGRLFSYFWVGDFSCAAAELQT